MNVTGEIGIWAPGFSRQLLARKNQIQHGWGAVAARCMAAGDTTYRVSHMYVEFENVSSPEDAITAPAFSAAESSEYYLGLAGSAVRDYLRVPLLPVQEITAAPGFDDVFPAGEGNKVTFYAQTTGSAGQNGKTFSDSVNSKVFGMALVAAPVPGDSSRDIVVARTYFDTAEQVLKTASSQISLTWNLVFGGNND